MRAGRLNQKITLRSHTATKNAIGEVVVAYSDVATVWAAVEPQKASEKVSGGLVLGESTYKVLIRYRSDVTSEWRIAWGDKTLEISSVLNPYNRNRELEIIASEIQ
jgi:SPP1 family predicted phage head-tail adaptor